MPSLDKRLLDRFPRPLARGVRSVRRGISYLLVRPEVERLRLRLLQDLDSVDDVAAGIVEAAAYVTRAARDLELALERTESPNGASELDVPYAHRALAALPAGSRVLVPPSEGRLSASLAAVGYDVVAKDPSEAGGQSFDAVVAFSRDEMPAPAALKRLRGLVKTGGLLVLTLPVDSRVRDPAAVAGLLQGWKVEECILGDQAKVALVKASRG